MLKRYFFVAALITLAIGCVKDPQKEADKMSKDVDAGNTMYSQGVSELRKAEVFLNLITSGAVPDSTQSRKEMRDQYLKARNVLLGAQGHYQAALDRADANKDTVKVSGRDSVNRSIAEIRVIVGSIDQRLKELDNKGVGELNGGKKVRQKGNLEA